MVPTADSLGLKSFTLSRDSGVPAMSRLTKTLYNLKMGEPKSRCIWTFVFLHFNNVTLKMPVKMFLAFHLLTR